MASALNCDPSVPRGHSGTLALAFIAAATGASLAQPLVLYAVALALLGLPHVLWELCWIQRVWGRVLAPFTVGLIGLALALQAWARLQLWRGMIDAHTAAWVDALTLALAVLAALASIRRVHAARRAWFVGVTLAVPAAILWASQSSTALLGLLAVLAMAHNFTPIVLVGPDRQLWGRPARRVLAAVFVMPWLALAAAWCWAHPLSPTLPWVPGEVRWAAQWAGPRGDQLAGALLSALVLAQCLHYACVLWWLPQSAGATPWKPLPALPVVLALCLGLSAAFGVDFTSARGLYAVAAGFHAWLEWPVLVLAVAASDPKA